MTQTRSSTSRVLASTRAQGMSARAFIMVAVFLVMLGTVPGLSPAKADAHPAAPADLPPGCNVYSPDAHIVTGRRVDVDYMFSCNNPRIRYMKVTLTIKRHRAWAPDATVESYQFDNFSDPSHAGINGSLQSDRPCRQGKRYHGDITINVSLNADQQYTETRRGRSVTCG
jgi:hypothetical protein